MQSLPHVQTTSLIEPLGAEVARIRDTCNVYVLRSGRDALVIDFGSGAVLDHLDVLGVDRVTDVLVTHHHRDQVQGLSRADAAGVRIWVPPLEHDLIARAGEHWQARPLDNDYDLRQDRFSLLQSVPVTGTVDEYRSRTIGGYDVFTLPTPGHTAGSVTYLVDVEGRRVAFSGDLVHGEGKVWSLAAAQWSYSDPEGLAATHVSCAVLADAAPDLLLPSHGPPIEDPEATLASVRARVQELVDLRREVPWNLADMHAHPWAPVTPHLLRNRAAFANSYALVSESGAALLIDFGYDVTTGLVPRTEREARRALLWPLDALRRDHGVERIEAVVPTHYHDDHVAGLDLLRAVRGTEVWAPENVAPILLEPSRYDLPCLWFEPIAVDRVLTLGEPLQWHEYELRLHALPGHTLYAAAIELEVDGKRVLATGDQQSGGDRPILNYQYRNRFRIDDFVASAQLYRSLRPDVIVSGHWPPQDVTDELLDRLLADGSRLAELHRELLPLDEADLGAVGFAARIEPYRSLSSAGGPLELDVIVRNPFSREAVASVALVVPPGWAEPEPQELALEAKGEAPLHFQLLTGGRERRARIAADVTVDGVRFGQQAEALVDVS
jgi:glyoxylase-like metal-dependent hydrolase (beta-lactamase superfamily II)